MADAAQVVKNTVEQATAEVAAKTQANVQAAKVQVEKAQAAGTQAFREVADKSVAGLTELNVQGKQNLEAMVASATAAQRGVEAISQQAMTYSKTSWENGVAAAQSISKARSVQELIELQTNFAKSAMETYMAEITRMTDTVTATVKDSFQPINERASASVERFQAAR